ncbi:MAG: hypothetical protein SGI72_05920 [Planctomycetota bacterium]|nr:hypothetical protein [Planctomycetota bacterium]
MSSMVDPISISGVGSVGGAPQAPLTVSKDGGAAFRALLDSLADRAKELEKTSAKPVDANELAGAVDEARDSLQDALSLIEAYRANVQSSSATPKTDTQ